MRKEITYKELFANYVDLENTQMIDLLRQDIQDQKATENTIIFISEVQNNNNIYDSEGNVYPYIDNKTFELSDSTNSFTIGYVYQK